MPRLWRMKALRSDGQVVPSCWAAALLRGRPKSVTSRAPDLAKRENSITPFDCPCDNAAQLFGELEGALGFAAVGEEPAGLPAHPWLEQFLTTAGPIASSADKTAVDWPARCCLAPSSAEGDGGAGQDSG